MPGRSGETGATEARTSSSAKDIDGLPLRTQPNAPSGPCAESSTTERSKFGSESGGAESSKPGANAEVIQLNANVPAGGRRSWRIGNPRRLSVRASVDVPQGPRAVLSP